MKSALFHLLIVFSSVAFLGFNQYFQKNDTNTSGDESYYYYEGSDSEQKDSDLRLQKDSESYYYYEDFNDSTNALEIRKNGSSEN
jgi:hypothetical protein